MKKTTNRIKQLLSLVLTLALLVTATVSLPSASAQTADTPATYIPGDISDDAVIDVQDAMRMYMHTSGGTGVDAVQQEKADYNRDGEVDMQDTMAVYRVASGEAKRKPAFTPPDEKALEVFALMNEERAKEGLEPLNYLYTSQELADIRAAECLVSFSHTRPNGDTCFSIANEFDMSGQNAWSGGENIAMGQITPDEAMTSWMNSPGHRSNILNASFNSVIVGVTPVKGVPGYSGYVWVQYFFY